MARPTKFDHSKAGTILDLIGAGATRAEAAGVVGIGARTLQTWIARGRAGVEPYAGFVAGLGQADRKARQLRAAVAWQHYQAEAPARWQRFKAARVAWWRARLGDAEFWRRRLAWLLEGGRVEAFNRTVAQMTAEGWQVG